MVSFDEEKIKSNLKTLGTWMYWIIGTIIIGTISYILYTRFNKQVAAILVFLVSMLALYYYYVKWLVIPGWQPHIGTCPDFMTKLGVLNNTTKQFVCSDTMNVYGRGAGPTNLNTAIAAVTANEVQTAKGNVTTSTGALVLTPIVNENTSNDVIRGFCTSLKEANISWINLCEMDM